MLGLVGQCPPSSEEIGSTAEGFCIINALSSSACLMFNKEAECARRTECLARVNRRFLSNMLSDEATPCLNVISKISFRHI